MMMASACWTTPAEPTPNIDATVEARAKELVAEQVNNLPPNPDLALDRQYANTIQELDKAIQLDPDDAEAYFNRGVAYGELGQYQTAINDYTKAIQLDTDNALAYANRGYSYRKLGQHERGGADQDKACSLDSQWC